MSTRRPHRDCSSHRISSALSMAGEIEMNPNSKATATDWIGRTESRTSSTSHPLQMFQNSTLIGDEDTHPRLTPLILVEPYGKPNVGSRFSTIPRAAHVWAKRSTTAAVALIPQRDIGLDARGGEGTRGSANVGVLHCSFKPSLGEAKLNTTGRSDSLAGL